MANGTGTLNKPDQDDDIQKYYDNLSDAEKLKAAEESLKGSSFESQSEGFNEQFAGQDKNGSSSEDLGQAEESPAASASSAAGAPDDLNYTSGDEGKQSKIKAAGNFVARNRKKFLIGGGVAGGIVSGFAIIAQLGTFLLPTLSNNIDEDRFKHIGRLLSNNNEVIVKLKMMLASTSDADYARALEEYKDGNPGSNLFKKVNELRPVKIAENLLLSSTFETREYTIPGTNIKREKIIAATVDGVTIPVPQNKYGVTGIFKHPIRWGSDHIDAYLGSRKMVDTLLNERYGGKLPLPVKLAIRGPAATTFRTSINASQFRWTKDQVDEADKDPPSSDVAKSDAFAQTYETTRESLPAPDADVAREIQAETDACVEEKGCRDRMINEGVTISPQSQETLNTSFNPTLIRDIIGHLSNVQAIAALVCTVAETSVQASEEVMNANLAVAAVLYTNMSAASGQQVYSQLNPGDKRVNAALTGGFNGQVNHNGTATNSVPMRRAAGQAFTTAAIMSPAAGAIGMFGTDPVGFLGAGVASAIEGTTCDVLTHWATGLGLAALEIGFSFTGGGAVAKVAGTTLVNRIASGFGKALAAQFTKASLLTNAALIGTEQVANIMTAISKGDALQQAGGLYNGMVGGTELIDRADAGGTVLAQAVSQQYGGAAMTTDAYLESSERDDAYIASATDQSFSQRYFAMDNSQSLANRVAMGIYGTFSLESIASSIQNMANFLSPGNLFGGISSLSLAGAAPGDNPDTVIQEREYGIPQFGWSNDEEDTYAGNDDYAPLHNEVVLDESGQREDLMEKYGKCFDPAKTKLGTLLADGDIARDENANVIADEGDCAPNKLGDSIPNNNRLDFENDEAELVFRLRISMRNERAVDDLLGIQNPAIVTGGPTSETDE
jgi:hypothetical protein